MTVNLMWTSAFGHAGQHRWSPMVCFVGSFVLVLVAAMVPLQRAMAQSYAFESRIPDGADGRIEEASAVALGPEGTLWMADPDAGALHRYDSTGTPQNSRQTLALRSGEVTLDEPFDLHVADDGTLYVLDRGAPAVYVVREDPEQSYAMGRDGNDLGSFDKVRSLAVDPGGAVFVLDEDQEYVAVFTPEGRFRTWIRGTQRDFRDVIAIGTNGRGELYLLEEGGPTVHIFDRYGRSIYEHDRLRDTPGVSLDDPADLTVLRNGDFLIVNRDNSKVAHFTRAGALVGTFGGQGRSGRGVFAEAARLASGGPAPDVVSVLDVDRKQAQTFRVPLEGDTLTYQPPRLNVHAATSTLPPFHDAVVAPDGVAYLIPHDDEERVIARDPSSDAPLFTLQVEDARALALHGSTLYVLDRDERQVLAYDREQGALLRKFGSDIPTDLDDPSDVATLANGDILVSDPKTGMIHRWNEQGVYQSSISPASSRQQEPAAIATDSRDRIYVWDGEKAALLRLTASGAGTEGANFLTLRTETLSETGGEAVGLLVDPLDQVHLFNATTQQHTVFDWSDQPQAVLRQGRPGDAFGYDDVVAIALDPTTFDVHVVENGGDAVVSFGISVRPKPPQGPPAFDAQGDTLVVSIPPVDDPAIVGYGLLRQTDGGWTDTVAVADTSRLLVPPQRESDAPSPPTYGIITRSPTSASQPTVTFVNTYGHASRLFATGAYDDALTAYRDALDAMDAPPAMQTFVGERFARLGKRQIQAGEAASARRYLQAARSLAPESDVVAEAMAVGYTAQLRGLARREQYDDLLTTIDAVLGEVESSDLREDILHVADSVAADLRATPHPSAREQAVAYYKQLLEWGAPADVTHYQLARAWARLYDLKVRTNAPSYEQDVALDEALQAAGTAVQRQSTDSPHYHDARLVQLRLLLQQGAYQQVVSGSSEALGSQTVPMDDETSLAYRTLQARGYEGQDNDEEAVRVYQRLVSEAPDDADLKVRLADALVETGAHDDAKSLYQRLLSNRGEDATLIMKIGIVELERGNFSEASLQLEKAVDLDPDLTEAYGPLAEAYDGTSNYRNAIDAYKRAIQATQRRRSSIEDADRREALTADLVSYRTSLGRIYSQMGDYEQAVETYQQLTETAPSQVDTWYGLGSAALGAGQVYEAIDALNRALKLEPTSEKVSQQLQRARAQRDQIQANRPPAEILTARIDPLYPSLYRNYSDPASLPIGEAVLANNTTLPMQNLRLTVYVEPLMSAPTEQDVRSLASFSNKSIPIGAVFNDSILQRTQEETFQAEITLTYRQDGEEKTTTASPSFTLYGRNAIKWTDRRRLAAFVSPQDEEIINYVKAADRAFSGAPSYGLNDNVMKAAQLYTVLLQEDLTYSVDPQTDFSVVSQDPTKLDFLQFPEETLQRKAGDCDDLVALYASLMQNAGLKTAYVDVPGHVMVAFDTGLAPDELGDAGLSEDEVIVALGEVWIPIEATFLDGSSFQEAWQQGLERFREEQAEGNVPELVSISDAQEMYEPASFTLASDSLRLPADPSVLQSAYQEQAGTLYAQATQVRRADLEQQYEQTPSNLVVANELAILYAQGGMLEDAASMYQKALEQSPASALLLNNYGNVLFRQAKYEEALANYRESLALDDSDALVYVNVARTLLALGRTEEARTAFQTAVSKRPSVQDAYVDLRSQL